jgi:nitroimidazol reductase NimA-like FMN-containing flavoprotein (pyridoxamine 5'-phosphate oxidase superfamily)
MSSDEAKPTRVASVEKLEPADCWELLASVEVGRIGLLVDGRPEVLPVNFVIEDGMLLFRTTEGSVLNQATLSVVAFEADQIDTDNHSGWSVMVQGTARDIGDAIDTLSTRLRTTELVTWAPGKRERWFEIQLGKITGRRIRVG